MNSSRDRIVNPPTSIVLGILASLVASGIICPRTTVAQEPADRGPYAPQLTRLRDLAEPFFDIGVGVGVGITERPKDWNLLTKHFEYVTPENCMKVQGVQPNEGQFQFDKCDKFVEFASERELKLVGHCLVWAKDDRTPAWFFNDNGNKASAELLLSRMKTHIETVAERYQGKIAMWDVVNEALADGSSGYLRDSGWTRATGEDFIVKAFQYARSAAPDAMLIYNDYRCDTEGKRNKLVRLAKMFKKRGAPVDAIGLQGHYELDAVPFEGLEEMFKAIRELGFKVVVSELDIDIVTRGRWWADDGKHREELASFNPYKDGCPPEILQRQADQYAQLFELFMEYSDVIQRVSFWNLHDGQSWLNYFPWNRVNYPLLFDRNKQPKPAYFAVIDAMTKHRAEHADHIINIWPKQPPGPKREVGAEADMTKDSDKLIAGRRIIKLGNVSTPQAHVFLPPKEKRNGASVVICPGGGFHILAWDLEGTEVAEWLNSLGVTAVVLKYRVPTADQNPRWLASVQDTQRTVSLVRANAAKWKLDKQKIAVLGFSAGGVAAFKTSVAKERHYKAVDSADEESCEPNRSILIYAGGLPSSANQSPDDSDAITTEAPPTFIAHAFDDFVPVQGTANLMLALKRAGVASELHIYDAGGHGYGLRHNDEFPVTDWIQPCEAWLRRAGWIK